MQTDFERDLLVILRERLVGFGCKRQEISSGRDVVHQYLNVAHRLVEPRPRHVVMAKCFQCPDHLAAGLKTIVADTEAGRILTRYLSSRIFDPEYNDMLLNDWGVHHLHLGQKADGRGLVTRSKDLLFVLFKIDTAYLVAVRQHGSWAAPEIIDPILSNWPELLDGRCLTHVRPPSQRFSEQNVIELRKSGVTVPLIGPDSRVYVPIGGGYVTSGLSLRVRHEASRLLWRIRQLEKHVVENTSELLKELQKLGVTVPADATFTLQIDDGIAFALLNGTRGRVRLGALDETCSSN